MIVEQKVVDFLTSERVCVLAVMLPDGSPHVAAMHYSHTPEPLVIYIQTENTSRKCQGLLSGQAVAASVVVGFNEQEMVTLQMDGQICLVTDQSKLPDIHQVHYAKHPQAKQYKSDPTTVFLAFTPSRWRLTDYKVQPPVIIENGK